MLTDLDRDRISILQTMIKRLLADSSDEMRMRRTLREAGDMIRELVGLIDSIPDNKPLVDLTVEAPARPKPAPKPKTT